MRRKGQCAHIASCNGCRRRRIRAMNIAGIRIAPWIGVFGLLFFVVTTTLSQVAPGSEGQVTLSRLSPPVFPPLARVARVNGEVEIALQVRQDGSVESAAVVKGHPLLKAAALDSARQSEFECRECGEGLTAYTLLYTFAYTSTDSCCKPEEISQGTTHAGVTQA